MSEFFDALETRDPAEREAALMAALPRQIAHAQVHSAARMPLWRLAAMDMPMPLPQIRMPKEFSSASTAAQTFSA